MGLDSFTATEFADLLSKALGVKISNTLVIEYPNIKSIIAFLPSAINNNNNSAGYFYYYCFYYQIGI